ncbi:MAG TPA: hypothetical protein VE440_07270 [Gaiellaceae bacterium]|nr:hypothetical protein [Gaiellaceae bacterium]
MGRRRERLSRALQMLGTARRSRLLWVLREVGLAGQRPATAEAAREFRLALEELGTTYVKLGQVGKTLAQADSIARALDPDLDPIELLREDTFELMLGEAERRLAPTELAGYALTQLGPLARLPRRVGQIADRLETGTLRVGITPTHLEGLEAVMRSAPRTGSAPPSSSRAFCSPLPGWRG